MILHYWGGEIFQFQQPFSIIGGGAKVYLRPPSIYIGRAIAPFAPPESQSLVHRAPGSSWIAETDRRAESAAAMRDAMLSDAARPDSAVRVTDGRKGGRMGGPEARIHLL